MTPTTVRRPCTCPALDSNGLDGGAEQRCQHPSVTTANAPAVLNSLKKGSVQAVAGSACCGLTKKWLPPWTFFLRKKVSKVPSTLSTNTGTCVPWHDSTWLGTHLPYDLVSCPSS